MVLKSHEKEISSIVSDLRKAGLSGEKIQSLFREEIVQEIRKETGERKISFESKDLDNEKREITLSFASEVWVRKWWGYEKINFTTGRVNLERMKAGGALLWNHNSDKQIGVVEDAWLDGGRAFAKVRFSQNSFAEEVFRDVKDKIIKNVSFGYTYDDIRFEREKDGIDYYVIEETEVLEISLVSVPADYSVGLGRSNDSKDAPQIIDVLKYAKDKALRDLNHSEKESIEMTVRTVEGAIEAPKDNSISRGEVSEMLKYASEFNERELALDLIQKGQGLQELKDSILKRISARDMGASSLTQTVEGKLGLTRKEAQGFRFSKVLAAISSTREDWSKAGFEKEVIDEAIKKYGHSSRENFAVIPPEILFGARADADPVTTLGATQLSGTDTTGGNVIAQDLLAQSFIEILRSRLVVRGLGATVLSGLQGNVAIPKQTGTATAEWLPEGKAPTGSRGDLDQIEMRPKRVATFSEYTRQFLVQASIDVELFIRNDLAAVIARALDKAVISGSGQNQEPLGILTNSTINSDVVAQNGTISFGNVVDLETKVAEADADFGSLAYLTNATVRGLLKKTPEEPGDPKKIWTNEGGEGRVNGYRAAVSNLVPRGLNVIFGDWSSVLIGEWGGLMLQANPFIKSSAGVVRIDIEQHADVNYRYAESFSKIVDSSSPGLAERGGNTRRRGDG
ncbi:MAG: phage major capsid protein [Oligoflexus sp.]